MNALIINEQWYLVCIYGIILTHSCTYLYHYVNYLSEDRICVLSLYSFIQPINDHWPYDVHYHQLHCLLFIIIYHLIMMEGVSYQTQSLLWWIHSGYIANTTEWYQLLRGMNGNCGEEHYISKSPNQTTPSSES